MTTCPGCGIELAPRAGAPVHPYIGASAECWALYGELLAREYQDPARFSVHQLTVDTYAVQHPGEPERRSIQSVGLHLMTLCMFVEAAPTRRMGRSCTSASSEARTPTGWTRRARSAARPWPARSPRPRPRLTSRR